MSMVLDMLSGAAATEPAAAAMLDEWADRRIDVATQYARAAAETGQLAVSDDHLPRRAVRDHGRGAVAAPGRRARLD